MNADAGSVDSRGVNGGANIAAALAGNPLQFILPQRAPERLSAAPTAKAVGAACHRHPGSD